jgi:YggT family protein
MSAMITVVSLVVQIYEFLILIRVLLSWVNTDPYHPTLNHPIVRLLYQLTDPVLEPLRRIIPPIGGVIDISPVVALIILEIARRVLIAFLAGL